VFIETVGCGKVATVDDGCDMGHEWGWMLRDSHNGANTISSG